MLIRKKINFQLYFVLSMLNLLICSYANSREFKNFFFLLILFFTTIVNHFFLARGIELVLRPSPTQKNKGFWISFYFLGKTILLAAVLYYLLTYHRDLVFFLIILYIFQLIILVLSIKKAK